MIALLLRLWVLARARAAWLALVAVLVFAWGWIGARTAAREWAAVAQCDAAWRARESAASVQAMEAELEALRQMGALRPDPAAVDGRLRDGSFFLPPAARREALPAGCTAGR